MYENPPCDTCNKPTLLPTNQRAWEAWTLLSAHRPNHGFGIESISLESVMNLCDVYQLSIEDMEKILFIERKIVDGWRDQRLRDKNA